MDPKLLAAQRRHKYFAPWSSLKCFIDAQFTMANADFGRRIAHSAFTPLEGFEEFLQVLRSRHLCSVLLASIRDKTELDLKSGGTPLVASSGNPCFLLLNLKWAQHLPAWDDFIYDITLWSNHRPPPDLHPDGSSATRDVPASMKPAHDVSLAEIGAVDGWGTVLNPWVMVNGCKLYHNWGPLTLPKCGVSLDRAVNTFSGKIPCHFAPKSGVTATSTHSAALPAGRRRKSSSISSQWLRTGSLGVLNFSQRQCGYSMTFLGGRSSIVRHPQIRGPSFNHAFWLTRLIRETHLKIIKAALAVLRCLIKSYQYTSSITLISAALLNIKHLLICKQSMFTSTAAPEINTGVPESVQAWVKGEARACRSMKFDVAVSAASRFLW